MAKSNKKELKKVAKRLIDTTILFPRSKIDFRSKLSKYQVGKINKALKEIERIADGYTPMMRDFVPLKGYKKYNEDNKLPPYMRGIFLTGGNRDNKDVKYRNGQISYTRGDSERVYVRLNNWSERMIRESFKEEYAKLPSDGKKNLTANGRVMRNTLENTAADMEAQAIMIFNKYKGMSERGEYREERTGKYDKEGNEIIKKKLAAHPKKWGIGILWEAPSSINGIFDTLTVDQQAATTKRWGELTRSEKAGWAEGAKHFKSTKFEAFTKVFNS